jgi:hypothetical protein
MHRAPDQETTTKPNSADRAAVEHSATANLMRDDSALGHRIIAVSRHPSVVRRQVYGQRRVASKSTSPSAAAQENETATPRPQDALDKLLAE